MRTVEWPPDFRRGRGLFVEGPEATRIMVLQVLGDLRQNPYNPANISLGDLTFRVSSVVTAKIHNALSRLSGMIIVQSVTEKKNGDEIEVTIDFLDRETRNRGSVTING